MTMNLFPLVFMVDGQSTWALWKIAETKIGRILRSSLNQWFCKMLRARLPPYLHLDSFTYTAEIAITFRIVGVRWNRGGDRKHWYSNRFWKMASTNGIVLPIVCPVYPASVALIRDKRQQQQKQCHAWLIDHIKSFHMQICGLHPLILCEIFFVCSLYCFVVDFFYFFARCGWFRE